MIDLPRSTSQVSAEWLTAALREGGQLGPVDVAAVAVEPMAAGVGFMCEVSRLRVTYGDTGPAGPPTMIVKIPTQDASVREVMRPARVFEREGRFYLALRDHPGLPIPRCWFSGIDVDADDFVLVLEDLADLRVGDQLASCTPDEAADALRALARFHATFWGNESLTSLSAWLPDINADINKVAGTAVYASSLPRFLEVFGELLSPEMTAIAGRFGANSSQLLDRAFAMPHTVTHFDFRLDNIFFAPGTPEPVRFFDFQAVARGGAAYDVGYFLSQSLRVEDRRAHEHDLLAEYHRTLVAAGVRDYDLSALRADVRVGIMYGWIIPVWAVGGLDVSSDRAMRLWSEVVVRAQAAITDHGTHDLFTDGG